MPQPDQLGYHEGLTELLQIKHTMFRTVWRYCLIGLGVAAAVGVIAVFAHSFVWADIRDLLRGLLH